MKTIHDIIKRPIVTERSMLGQADRKYTFEVAKDSNKIEIKNAVEAIFGVKVESVNTLNVRGRYKKVGVHSGKTPAWKKAVVKLTEGSKTIEFFDSLM